MKGLTSEEAEQLAVESRDPDRVFDEDSGPERVLTGLVGDGRVRVHHLDPTLDEHACDRRFEITPLGRLALRVCTRS